METNWKEDRVITALKRSEEPLTIRQLAWKCFPGVRPVTKADSRVRNALRRPVREKLVRQVGEGTYESTGKASKRT